jgi:hypothetical protein
VEAREDLFLDTDRFSNSSSPSSSLKSQNAEAFQPLERLSTPHPGDDSVPPSSPSKHKRKSPLVLRGELPEPPELDLCPESKSILSQLLLESNLLEVTVNETQYLWKLWLKANTWTRSLVFIDPNTKTALNPFNRSSSQKRKVTPEEKVEPVVEETPALEPNGTATAKKRKSEVSVKKEKPSVASSEKVVPKKKGRRVKDKEGKKAQNQTVDPCSMGDKCLKPTAQEVNWVFCEGQCQDWLHQLCAGISQDEVETMDKYFCPRCLGGDEDSAVTVTGTQTPSIPRQESSAESCPENADSSVVEGQEEEAAVDETENGQDMETTTDGDAEPGMETVEEEVDELTIERQDVGTSPVPSPSA